MSVPSTVMATLRSYLREPAVPDPPVRVWRDWALVAAISVSAILESTLRRDEEWLAIPIGWRIAAVVVFVATMPLVLLIRRTRPLAAIVLGFVPAMTLSAVMSFGGLMTMIVILIVPYSLYRWGSGRAGGIGALVLLGAWFVGNVADPGSTLGEWIGGFIVLTLPLEIGLVVRYRESARERAIREAKSLEREEIARELHDTVAHHVSAIAVQAQAGRAVAAADPQRALDVLAVIEEAASRTLTEMRTMVGTLRDGAAADLAPQQGVADLARLARESPGDLRVDVDIDGELGAVGPAVDAAIYRIAQESITNAVRHARDATRVEVRLAPAGELVRLTVSDDGMASSGPGEHGYGLLGMAERAHLLGGHLTAGPVNGRGWRVVAELPRAKAAT